jgi:hypothetical protein
MGALVPSRPALTYAAEAAVTLPRGSRAPGGAGAPGAATLNREPGALTQVAGALGALTFDAHSFAAPQGSFGAPAPRRARRGDPLQLNGYLFNRANALRFIDVLGAYIVQSDDTLWGCGILGVRSVE